jgi:GT2 family glycosyltransferase
MAARLTFAVPCHGGERWLPGLLQSLLAQRLPDCRLLLVDDASPDASVAVARKVAGDRLEVVRNESRLGIPRNWSRCAELVETEFFCLAHQDDVYAPDFAATLTAALADAPGAAAAHCRLAAIDGAGRRHPSPRERYKERFWRTLPAVETAAAGFRRLYYGNYVGCPSLVYRTAAFRKVGPFDAHYRFAPDWEWLLRAHAKGWQLAAVPEVLVSYRRHDEQASRHAARSLQRYYEEHAVLQHAHAFGCDAGFLTNGERSPAMRDNLLYDALGDLERRDRAAAQEKLDLLARLDPRARASAPARAVASALHLGWPGRAALRLAVSGWVAWAAR